LEQFSPDGVNHRIRRNNPDVES